MTTSESKGRFFLQNESIRIDSHNESNRIANWNALLPTPRNAAIFQGSELHLSNHWPSREKMLGLFSNYC